MFDGIEQSTIDSLDATSASELRATAKWLCGAAGGLVAALVAGLQLKDLATLEPNMAAAALVLAGLTVVSAGAVLYLAASVLACKSPSLQTLVAKDRADGGQYPDPRIDEPRTKLMKHLLVERRLELLGPSRDSIESLVVDSSAVHRGLWRGQGIRVEDRSLDPSVPDDLAKLRELATEVDQRLRAVRFAAEHWTVRTAFTRLKMATLIGGTVLIASTLGFAWISVTSEQRIRVTKPVPSSVQVPRDENEAEHAGFARQCAGMTLDVMMVGGWVDAPVIVNLPSGDCPSRMLSPGDRATVVPSIPN